MTVVLTLTNLLSAVSLAVFNERVHQDVCRSRRADLSCEMCLQAERRWMDADDALSEFRGRVAVGAEV